MASLKLSPGDVFRLAGTGADDNPEKRHRYVCLAVNADGSDYLVVPICTPQAQSDRTCELTPQDYALLNRRSYVAYHLMREITQRTIDSEVFGNQLKPEPPMAPVVFRRVLAGVTVSQESKPRLQAYLATHGGAHGPQTKT
jgi:hypothetical protein